LILSPDDTRLDDLLYQAGDKFTIKKLDDTFDADYHRLFEGKQVIVEIQGYGLSHEGVILYDARVIEPDSPDCNFHWLLSDKDLEESFYYLGADYQSVRGFLIDA